VFGGRVPGLLRRRGGRHPVEPGAGIHSAAGGPAPGPTGPGPSTGERASDVWATLPALRPVSGPAPSSVDSIGFTRTLTARARLASVLRPPQHAVVAESGGLVRGLTSVVARHAQAATPDDERTSVVPGSGRGTARAGALHSLLGGQAVVGGPHVQRELRNGAMRPEGSARPSADPAWDPPGQPEWPDGDASASRQALVDRAAGPRAQPRELAAALPSDAGEAPPTKPSVARAAALPAPAVRRLPAPEPRTGTGLPPVEEPVGADPAGRADPHGHGVRDGVGESVALSRQEEIPGTRAGTRPAGLGRPLTGKPTEPPRSAHQPAAPAVQRSAAPGLRAAPVPHSSGTVPPPAPGGAGLQTPRQALGPERRQVPSVGDRAVGERAPGPDGIESRPAPADAGGVPDPAGDQAHGSRDAVRPAPSAAADPVPSAAAVPVTVARSVVPQSPGQTAGPASAVPEAPGPLADSPPAAASGSGAEITDLLRDGPNVAPPAADRPSGGGPATVAARSVSQSRTVQVARSVARSAVRSVARPTPAQVAPVDRAAGRLVADTTIPSGAVPSPTAGASTVAAGASPAFVAGARPTSAVGVSPASVGGVSASSAAGASVAEAPHHAGGSLAADASLAAAGSTAVVPPPDGFGLPDVAPAAVYSAAASRLTGSGAAAPTPTVSHPVASRSSASRSSASRSSAPGAAASGPVVSRGVVSRAVASRPAAPRVAPLTATAAAHRVAPVAAPGMAATVRRDPGEIAIAAGIATRDSAGSVVFAPPAVVQVQRQEAAPGPAPVPASTEPVSLAPPAAPGPPGAATPGPDIAAMADELYERIERRLRSDLLLERERRGLLADP
jgi:hypothetical protein